MRLSGKARIAGVMGWPVAHSRSPLLHGFWLEEHGIDGAYIPLPVKPEDLPAALAALPRLGFAGCNLTLPHKEAALTLVDRIDGEARRIGAVNTIIVDGEGKLEGRNTDGFGFLANLRTAGVGFDGRGAIAVVIGAGGGARAVVASLGEAGAAEIRLVNRHRARAENLARTLGGPIRILDWADRAEALAGASLLVNTTRLGMKGEPPLELSLDRLPRHAIVTDIVYVPLITPLLAAAWRRGNPVVDGLGMLLHQARPGFAAWFGVMPEVSPALRAAAEASF
ncbi:MAG TPA: shikimate dehydrogenase [Stellaceae bacterium]|nr:shikimate dehydrogenase [Stellaceae bacterium]